MKWPWITRAKYQSTLADLALARYEAIQARKLAHETQQIAETLSRELSKINLEYPALVEQLRAIKLSAPEASQRYAAVIERFVKISADEAFDNPREYSLNMKLDSRAPTLFGHGDAAAWAFFAESVGREVAAKVKQLTFLQPYSAPLTSKTAGS